MKTIICQRCSKEVEVSSKFSNRQKYCRECSTIIHKERAKNHYHNNKSVRSRSTEKCSCGCGRPVGKGLRFLSEYCYKLKQNDEEYKVWS